MCLFSAYSVDFLIGSCILFILLHPCSSIGSVESKQILFCSVLVQLFCMGPQKGENCFAFIFLSDSQLE